MKLRTKLIVIGALGVALPALLFAASSWALHNSSQALTRVHAENMEPAVLLGRMDALLKNSRGHINAGYVHNPAIEASRLHSHPITLHSNAIRTAIKEVRSMWKEFSARPHAAEEMEAIAVIEAGLQDYIDRTLQPAADALDAADYDRAVRVVTTTFKSYRGIEEAIASLQNAADARAKAEVLAAQTLLQRIGLAALFMALAGMAVGLGLVWATQRSIRGSVNVTLKLSSQLREGELRAITVPEGRDELLDICHNLNATVVSLAEVLQRVQGSAQRVNEGAVTIANGSSDLSRRTDSQTQALEQIAAAVEQLQSAVSQTTQHASQAVALAQRGCGVAEQAGRVVGEVVNTMQQINDSSRRVSDITSVIDGIAFQTNILALNAAVEAARAGEHGRGFAVVAAEVRSLAQRAALAAKEIKTLIGASVERVEQGSQLVDKARDTMSEVVHAINQTAVLLGQISDASSEQREGVKQIGVAVQSMDSHTQHSAGLAQRSSAAAADLNAEADHVLHAVSFFRFDAPTPR